MSIGLLWSAGVRAENLPASLLIAGLQERSHVLIPLNPSGAAHLADESIAFARTQAPGRGRDIAIATGEWLKGEADYRRGDLDNARPLIANAIYIVERQAPESKLHADLIRSRAHIEGSDHRVEASLADLQHAFQIFSRLHDRREGAATLQYIGLLYQNAGDAKKALYYYAQSQEMFSGEILLDLSNSNNRANALDDLKQFDAAEFEYVRALRLASRINSSTMQAQVLNNLAVVQVHLHDYISARRNIYLGLHAIQSPANSQERSLLLATLARVELEAGNISQSRAVLDNLFKMQNVNYKSDKYRDAHMTAYQVYEAVGESNLALYHLEMYQRMQNDNLQLIASSAAALMAAKFDFTNQNARITALKADKLQRDIMLTQLHARQSQIILGGLLSFSIALAFVLGLYLRALQRSRSFTRSANARLRATNADLEYAMQAKAQFLATTSHEIRTPLNGVLGMTQVLLANIGLDHTARGRVQAVQSAGETMKTLIDDLLDLAKMESRPISLSMSEIRISDLLEELVSLWRDQAVAKGVDLCALVKNPLPMIMADRQRLRQILSNLLSNAIKFTPSGKIEISAESLSKSRFQFTVTDTGIGIAEIDQDKIFDKFEQLDNSTTRRFGGTGLGLSISRNLARAMGGDICVHSIAGTGSTFILDLPFHPVPALTVMPNQHSALDDVGCGALCDTSLAIVESNPVYQSAYRAILRSSVRDLAFLVDMEAAQQTVEARRAELILVSTRNSPASTPGLARLIEAVQAAGAAMVVIVDDDHPDRLSSTANVTWLRRSDAHTTTVITALTQAVNMVQHAEEVL